MRPCKKRGCPNEAQQESLYCGTHQFSGPIETRANNGNDRLYGLRDDARHRLENLDDLLKNWRKD
jgi:hypothetical protein